MNKPAVGFVVLLLVALAPFAGWPSRGDTFDGVLWFSIGGLGSYAWGRSLDFGRLESIALGMFWVLAFPIVAVVMAFMGALSLARRSR